MKKQLIIMLTATLAIPVLAQQTNNLWQRRGEAREGTERTREHQQRPEWTAEQRKEHMERRYQFMDRALSEIGVSNEDRIKIRELQEAHRQEMKNMGERLHAAQINLAKLLDSGASDEEIEAAIKTITKVQTEQLRLLVGNRRQMEKLLGREKYALFMDNARLKFREYGRRGGSGLPPRPGLPPIPGQDGKRKDAKEPPLPNAQTDTPPPPPK